MSSPAFGPMPTQATIDQNLYTGIMTDSSYVPPAGGDVINDVMPTDATVAMLDSQGFMPAGTADVIGSDATGQNATYSNPSVNPNPTGGWMTALKGVLSVANNAFTTYAKGSPAVATPPPRATSTSFFGSTGSLSKPLGKVGGVTITSKSLLMVGVGVVILGVLVWRA